MATKTKTATAKNIELNRWCIEMAMRWPVVTAGGGSGAYVTSGGMPYQQLDANVIGRADKIMAWVKAQH